MERASERERWRDDARREDDDLRHGRHGDGDHPGQEWAHERTSSGAPRREEQSWQASPRDPQRRHGAHGSGATDPHGGLGDEGRYRRPEDSPGAFGERSYGGYGDWSADRPDDQRMAGWHAERRRAGNGGDERSAAARSSAGGGAWAEQHGADPRGATGARSGRFAGRGPRGYRRSDERIHEDVCELLLADGEVDASDIEVTVQAGEVTLQGTVPERRMKRAAEDLIESVSGVLEVANRLRVQSVGVDGAVDSSGRRIA